MLGIFLCLFFKDRAKVFDWMAYGWFGVLKFVNNLKFQIEGQEKMPTSKGKLIVSNHQSHLDIPAVFYASGGGVRMVAKKELLYVPFFGFGSWLAGHIFVDRKNPESRRITKDKIKEKLATGQNVYLAPEGTRSKSKALGTFKKGAFFISRALGEKLYPVIIFNGGEVLSKKDIVINCGQTIYAKVLDPIDPVEHGFPDARTYASYVRDLMQKEIEAWKSPTA